MATLDFAKGVDFSPLERLGVNKEDGMKFLAALSPMIDLEFQSRIKSPFSDDETAAIGTEAEGKGWNVFLGGKIPCQNRQIFYGRNAPIIQ